MNLLPIITGLLILVVHWSTAQGACDISQCSVTIYKDCQAAIACGSRSGVSCAYLPNGISTTGCAWNPCAAVVGNGQWQTVCGGIDAIDIKGPCNAQLARQTGGGSPYSKIFIPGFHGVWATYENGVHFGDNVNSVKLSCADTDECASSSANNCSSNAICTNNIGSYTCSCKNGFSGDGFTCNDLDECKLGTHNCSVNADCTNDIGSFTCTCKPGFLGSGTSCDEGNHRVVCDENFMMIYLDSRIQTSDTSFIKLTNSSCTAKRYLPSNEYGIITTYDKCGTTKKETATHIVYENEVTWMFESSSGGIIRHGGKKIKFSCSFGRYHNTSSISLTPVASYITGQEDGYGEFSASIAMHTSQEFNSSVSKYPAVVTLNQRIHFEARIGSNDTDIIALIEKCSASPTTNRDDPSSYALIQNRCPVDSTTQFHNIMDNQRVQFSFLAFAFSAQMNTFYIHCQLFMCHKSSTDSRCLTSCQRSQQNRARRSLSDSLLVKSIQKREAPGGVYAPSKTIHISQGPYQVEQSDSDANPTGDGHQAGASTFTATHGLIVGVSVLGAALMAIAVKSTLKWRKKSQGRAAKNGANDLDDGTVNQGYELS